MQSTYLLRVVTLLIAVSFLAVGFLATVDTRRSVQHHRLLERVRRAGLHISGHHINDTSITPTDLHTVPYNKKCKAKSVVPVTSHVQSTDEDLSSAAVHRFKTGVWVYKQHYRSDYFNDTFRSFHDEKKDMTFIRAIEATQPCDTYIDVGGGVSLVFLL